MHVLVTGAAGFIGYHVAQRLLARGDTVVGLDNLNGYYDPVLKQARLALLTPHQGFRFTGMDLVDRGGLERLFAAERFTGVVHLAAQAGVRHSLTHPHAYVDANVTGFLNVLEPARQAHTAHFVFASSSSVYGLNTTMPFSTHQGVNHPVSLYAATKRANELMAHSYSHLYGLPTTGLRFFTVYGPWGRPDMALFQFTRAIIAGLPIDVYNHGKMQRDFTYIDDIAEGVVRVLDRPATADACWSPTKPDPASSSAPFRLYNIGNHQPVELLDFIRAIEAALGKKAALNFLPLQPGDVQATSADVDDLASDVGFAPRTPVAEGVAKFVDWYRTYY